VFDGEQAYGGTHPFFILGEQMEIKISKEELKTKSIFVATPMYGGMNHGLYAKAVWIYKHFV
jgi:hypothetical protein